MVHRQPQQRALMFSFYAEVVKTLQDPGFSSDNVQNAVKAKLQVSFHPHKQGQWLCAAGNSDHVSRGSLSHGQRWDFLWREKADCCSLLLGSYLKGLWMSRSMCSPLMKSAPSPGWTPMVSLSRWKNKLRAVSPMPKPPQDWVHPWFLILQ